MPVLASRFSAQWADQRGASFLKAIGRLRAGRRAAGGAIGADHDRGADRCGQSAQRHRTASSVRPFQDVLVKNYRPALIVLLGAVAAVLLIACANIANLLLARGTARRREMAIRTALGASRVRLVRQLLIESLTLAAVGGAAGTVVALWGVDALVRISPVQIPRLNTVHIDRSVLIFTVAGLAAHRRVCRPAPRAPAVALEPGDTLKDGDRGGSGGRGARTRQRAGRRRSGAVAGAARRRPAC